MGCSQWAAFPLVRHPHAHSLNPGLPLMHRRRDPQLAGKGTVHSSTTRRHSTAAGKSAFYDSPLSSPHRGDCGGPAEDVRDGRPVLFPVRFRSTSVPPFNCCWDRIRPGLRQGLHRQRSILEAGVDKDEHKLRPQKRLGGIKIIRRANRCQPWLAHDAAGFFPWNSAATPFEWPQRGIALGPDA